MKKIVCLFLFFLSCNLLVMEDTEASTIKWKGYSINSGQIGIVKFTTNVKMYKKNPNGSTSFIIGKKGQAYRVYELDKISKLSKNLTSNEYESLETTKYYLGNGVTVQGNEIIKYEQLPQNIYEQVIELYGYPVKSLVPPKSIQFGFDYIYSKYELYYYMDYNEETQSFKGCYCTYFWDETGHDPNGGWRGVNAEIKFNETKSAFSYALKLGEEETKVQIQYPVKKGSIVTITRPNGSIEKEKVAHFIPYEFYQESFEYTHVIVTEKGRKFAVGRYMNVTGYKYEY